MSEKDEMQMAIEESLKQQHISSAPIDRSMFGDQNNEEAQFQQAMLASLQSPDADFLKASESFLKFREEGIPAGLKNVGNTCYLNSLLQTYFMLPFLRNQILSYEPTDDAKEDDKSFMLELKRLFAHLQHTNQKWLDPSKLFRNMVDETGNIIIIGSQEDVGEFNDIFLHRIKNGLIHSKNKMEYTFDELFQPEAVEILNFDQKEGQETPFDFGRNFILPVEKDMYDFYLAIDSFMCDELSEWTTPEGIKTKAVKWRWMNRLPSILMFQQQRVGFVDNQQVKINYPLKFPKELWMDRYLLKNKNIVNERQGDIKEMRYNLKKVQEELSTSSNYMNKGISKEELLSSVIHYLNEYSNENNNEDLSENMKQFFDVRLKYEKEKVIKNEELRDNLLSKISSYYDDLNENCYLLYAVWVHSGGVGSGHYWSYIRDIKSDMWIKFNDGEVSIVDEETVFEDSIGGKGNTSAYYMMYIKKQLYESEKNTQIVEIKGELKKEVEEANQEFAKMVEKRLNNTNESRAESFVKLYNDKVKGALEGAKNIHVMEDKRISSYFIFLASLGLIDEMKVCIAKEMWLRTFTRGIEKDSTSEVFKIAGNKLSDGGLEFLESVVSFPQERLNKIEETYKIFRQSYQFMCSGLKFLNDERYSESLKYLLNAYIKNEQLEFNNLKNHMLIALIKINIILLSQEAIKLSSSSLFEDILHTFSVLNLDSEDDLVVYIRKVLLDELINSENLNEICEAYLSYSFEPENLKWKLHEPKQYESLSDWEKLVKDSKNAMNEFIKKNSDVIKIAESININIPDNKSEKMDIEK